MRLTLHLAFAFLVATTGCRTTTPDAGSAVKDDTTAPADPVPADPATPPSQTPPGVSAPFAQGSTDGINWQLRFNFPVCDHSAIGKKPGVWCEANDSGPSAKKSGIEDMLAHYVNDPKIKSIQMAYFSFSNKNMVRNLCNAANARGLKVNLYIHGQSIVENVINLKNCSPGNINVIPRGTTFGTEGGYLQHAKILLASEHENPRPLAVMEQSATADELTQVRASRTHITSSSANMSSFGTSLHLENWMFLDAPTDSHIAQSNLCFFDAIANMTGTDRKSFARLYRDCVAAIAAPAKPDLVFYPVPHDNINPQAYKQLLSELGKAQSEVKVAIHRLTASGLYNRLADLARNGKAVHVIFDDDTLRTGVRNGGNAHDVGANDVRAYRTLRDAGVKVGFMETNAETTTHLHHNKFIVIDDKVVFAGAGNFTATSLNTSSLGNIEHFYILKVPEMVKAYSDAWAKLRDLSTFREDHPVGANADRGVNCGGGALCTFTD